VKTVRIYRLTHLSATLFRRIKEAQMEAAKVWNKCCELHHATRKAHTTWPGRNELQKQTKRQFALYSQSVQMIVGIFLGNIETTRQLRQKYPKLKMKSLAHQTLLTSNVARASGESEAQAGGAANETGTRLAGATT
jgi:hypothetical protein